MAAILHLRSSGLLTPKCTDEVFAECSVEPPTQPTELLDDIALSVDTPVAQLLCRRGFKPTEQFNSAFSGDSEWAGGLILALPVI